MIFTEYRFLLFFGAVFAVHWGLRSNRPRKVFLLAASYVFYSVWDWRFLSLLCASTLCDYLAVLAIDASADRRARRAWLGLSLAVNLGILGVFKYLGFFLDSAVELVDLMGFEASRPALAIVLPIGISFYTFQTLSYTLDVYSPTGTSWSGASAWVSARWSTASGRACRSPGGPAAAPGSSPACC